MRPDDFHVELEFTPNPNTLKYTTSVPLLLAGACNFLSKADAEARSPLAKKLFDLDGVSAVMVGKSFVSVTLTNQDDLAELNDRIIDSIKDFLSTGDKAVIMEAAPAASAQNNLSEVEKKIVEILEKDIRPAVAMDGGDITFERFEDGIVFLQMKGSCSGCPSSTATLKMGIENRLREAIPEVTEVVAV
jgi:Fe-S cluster biogenesis protein NfuA